MASFSVFLNSTDVGTLDAQKTSKGVFFSFCYAQNWLNHATSFAIDPDLPLIYGNQYSHDGKAFGFLSDISPDRWGRSLIKRKLGRPIDDLDAIVEVSDMFRLGAIRIKNDQGLFLSQSSDIPTLVHLNQLLEAINDIDDTEKEVKMLFEPGSSLGGARPKASVIDTKNNKLLIAKFPKKDDEINIEAWELIALRLANACKINTCSARHFTSPVSNHSILLVERFDRKDSNRVPYMSGMTALNYRDGSGEGSYVELMDFIDANGNHEDGKELWKRMTFSMMFNNFDDHLRNHGFLMKNGQWRLSPAFDINPSVDKSNHALAIDDGMHEPDISFALKISDYFGVSSKESESYVKEFQKTINEQLNSMAKSFGISGRELSLVKSHLTQLSSDVVIPVSNKEMTIPEMDEKYQRLRKLGINNDFLKSFDKDIIELYRLQRESKFESSIEVELVKKEKYMIQSYGNPLKWPREERLTKTTLERAALEREF